MSLECLRTAHDRNNQLSPSKGSCKSQGYLLTGHQLGDVGNTSNLGLRGCQLRSVLRVEHATKKLKWMGPRLSPVGTAISKFPGSVVR